VEVAVQRFLDGAGRAPLGRAENGFGPLSSGPAGGSTRVAEVVEDAGASGTAALRVLGQHRNTYIVATDGAELVLVDQHTAHERVRYEALKSADEGHRVESQMLLMPVVFTLPPRLLPVLDGSHQELRAVGYDVEPFGGDAVRVSAVPAVLAGRDPAASLEHVLRDLLEREDAGGEMAEARHRVFATIACHSAARGGQPLAREAMAAIVAGLWQAAQPAVCPHGRPTRVRVPRDDVSRWFGRTGWRRQ
jgi:DNA mismatch repair protein MutL